MMTRERPLPPIAPEKLELSDDWMTCPECEGTGWPPSSVLRSTAGARGEPEPGGSTEGGDR